MGRGRKKFRELYIKQGEMVNFGGKRDERDKKIFNSLPYNCCKISMQPWKNPMATP